MKRMWAAVILLFCVIGGGWYNLCAVSTTVDTISASLEEATDAARKEDIQHAKQLLDQAHAFYLQKESYLSAVVSEKLLDEVRLGFARTEQSVQNGKADDLTVELAELEQAIDDLLRSEAVSLKNIF
ncbi:MAG: DUF4363 family protein [Clostridia bacterium]|nr:DUF4363 family protein [Clostridia bacterium]